MSYTYYHITLTVPLANVINVLMLHNKRKSGEV